MTHYNIASDAITWSPEESSFKEDEKGKVSITAVGYISTEATLLQARELVPQYLPITSNGPLGETSQFFDSQRTTVSISPSDACWKIEVGYEAVTSEVSTDDQNNELSDKDKFRRTAAPSVAPLLTHSVAQQFPVEELLKLKLLVDGKIIANINYGLEGEPTTDSKFVTEDPSNEFKFTKPIEFSEETVTVNNVTASPMDFAKAIRSGVTSYKTNSVRHIILGTRKQPLSESVYNKLQTIVPTPAGAVTLGRGRQWMLDSIEESSNSDKTWSFVATYEATGDGGALRMLYKGGEYELA